MGSKNIFAFLQKRPITVKFTNSVPKVFIATPIDVLCSNFVKFGRGEIGAILRCLPDKTTKNSAWLSSCHYTVRIAPKICQGQPPTKYSECSRFHPNRFTCGGVIAKRVNSAKTRRKVNPIFGRIRCTIRYGNIFTCAQKLTRWPA